MREIDPNDIIRTTESLCPHCLRGVPATVYERDGKVYMAKECPDHGEFDVYLWPDADHYRWCMTFDFPTVTRVPQTVSAQGCPKDCGLCPNHKTWVSLAEIEVTYKCNMHCPLCFMSAGEKISEPTFDELVDQMRAIRSREFEAVTLQITGGEPTVRKDLFDIVRAARTEGFGVVEVNTNGIVLGSDPAYAAKLRESGCSNVYLQFDGVTADVHDKLRRPGVHELKLKAIENCRAAGLPVVLSPAIVSGVNDHQLGDIIAFAMSNMDVIDGVSFQPAFESGRFDVEEGHRISMGDMVMLIEKQTGGRIRARDFYPLTCVSPLCDCSTFLIGDGNFYQSLARSIDEDQYRAFFADGSTQGSSFVDVAKRKYNGHSLVGLPVLIMCFMDAWTIDTQRVARCNLGVQSSDGRTIPFCSYHLTDSAGNRLYPYPPAID